MHEKELNSGLRQLISRGEVGLKITDEVVDCLLSQPLSLLGDRLDRVKSQLVRKIQNDAIERARAAIGSKILPFGRFIEAIRDEAKLTRFEIANRLGKEEEFLLRIERGDVNPVSVPPSDVANLLALFHITISKASATMNASGEVNATKRGLKAAARSHGGLRHDQRVEDTERALDALAARLRQKKAWTVPKPPHADAGVKEFMEKLSKELERRGRSDLLI